MLLVSPESHSGSPYIFYPLLGKWEIEVSELCMLGGGGGSVAAVLHGPSVFAGLVRSMVDDRLVHVGSPVALASPASGPHRHDRLPAVIAHVCLLHSSPPRLLLCCSTVASWQGPVG